MLAFVEKAGLENDRFALVSYKNSQEKDKKTVTSLRILYHNFLYQSYLKHYIELILCFFQDRLLTIENP